jgi:hypothetical protein
VSTRNNFVLYSLYTLGPATIGGEINYMRESGFTTIVIGMFHIGNPEVAKDTQLGDIIFNGGKPLVIRDGKYVANAPHWPGQIGQLKQGTTSVTKVYACFGGGDPVQDFSTIKSIYEKNGNSFQGTMLKKNLEVFRQVFPAFDGIDMDCEDVYDLPSFVAFCDMMIGLGFDITFCPYAAQDFWNTALAKVSSAHPGAVKWWNLQCYAGGAENNPKDWSPANSRPGYIIPGDWVRFWDPNSQAWFGDCPQDMQNLFATFAQQTAVGGGFVYELDLIRDTIKNIRVRGTGCAIQEPRYASIYLQFVKAGLGVK